MESKKITVLEFINDKDYVPMKFNDIAAILNVPEDDKYILQST